MRCPQCRYMASDKRDICPKCFVDLRPEKSRMGVPIVDKEIAYEALLEVAKKNAVLDRKRPPSSYKSKSQNKKTRSFQRETGKSFFGTLFDKLFPARGKYSPPAKISVSPPETISVVTEAVSSDNEQELLSQELDAQLAEFTSAATLTDAVTDKAADISLMATATTLTDDFISSVQEEKGQILDDLAFEKLFDDIDEVSLSPAQTTEEPTSLSSINSLRQIGQELEDELSSMQESTEKLRDLGNPGGFPIYPPAQVAPEVMEFNDDDLLLEEQLDEMMLGSDVLHVSAVKSVAPKAPPPPQMLQVSPDLEISFEFDFEDAENAGVAPATMTEQTVQPEMEEEALVDYTEETHLHHESSPEEMLKTLEAALGSLESALDERSIAEEQPQFQPDEVEEGLEAELAKAEKPKQKIELPQIPRELRSNPEALSAYLLNYIAGAMDCSAEQLFEPEEFEEESAEEFSEEVGYQEEEVEYQPEYLSREPEIEDDVEPTNISSPIPVGWRSAAEQNMYYAPEGTSDDALAALEAELDGELSALSDEGFSVFSEAPVEQAVSVDYEESYDELMLSTPEPEEIPEPLPPSQASSILREPSVLPGPRVTSGPRPAAPKPKEELKPQPLPEPATMVEDSTYKGVVVGDEELLWEAVEEELKEPQNSDEEEISLFVPTNPSERCLVLFDSALAAIENPEIDSSYKSNLKVSVSKEIDSNALEKVFKTYGDKAAEDYAQGKIFNKQPAVLPNAIRWNDKSGDQERFPSAGISLLTVVKNIFLAFVGSALYTWFISCSESTRALVTMDGPYWPLYPKVSHGLVAMWLVFLLMQLLSRSAVQYDQVDSSDLVE